MELVTAPEILPAADDGRSQVLRLVDLWLGQVKPSSAKTYRAALEAFAQDAGMTFEGAIAGLFTGPREAAVMAQSWRAMMRSKPLAPKTINTRLAALRSLIKFAAADLHVLTWQLMIKDVKAARMRDTRGPGTSGFIRLYSAAQGLDARTVRDRAIVRMLFSMALRRAEVQALDVAHVEHAEQLLDHPSSRVWVVAKGSLERLSVSLPRNVRRDLAAWLKIRGMAAGPLFVAINRWEQFGGRLSLDGYNFIVARLAARAEMSRVRPHGLRHAAITEACRQMQDIRKVQEFSRHKDLNTVQHYLDAAMDEHGEVAGIVDAVGEVPDGQVGPDGKPTGH